MVKLELIDVTLRDGLQMESRLLGVAEKTQLFERILSYRPARIEVTSFVSPKWVPQFADAESFLTSISPKLNEVPTMAFVPNEKGLLRLLAFPIPWVSAFVAASETFNQKNVAQGISETVAELGRVTARARKEKRKVRIYLSTLFGCPYEGDVPMEKIKKVLAEIADLGPDEIALSDTLGTATLSRVKELVQLSGTVFPLEKTALHVHNTYGNASLAIATAHELGIKKFDASLGGLGGCPYAKGATGNVAMEDVTHLFQRQKMDTGLDWRKLCESSLTLETEFSLKARSRIREILSLGGKPYGIS